MLSGDETEAQPMTKSAQRKGKAQARKAREAERRKQKAAAPEPHADQPAEAVAVIETPVVAEAVEPDRATPIASIEEASLVPAAAPVAAVEASPLQVPAVEFSATASQPVVEAAPVSYQAIADSYCNYALQSLEQTQSFFGRLAAVRSIGKLVELQTEFAKQAYDGFVTESQKLHELHGRLARQRLQEWESAVTRMIRAS